LRGGGKEREERGEKQGSQGARRDSHRRSVNPEGGRWDVGCCAMLNACET
jgi:hypothetical protein